MATATRTANVSLRLSFGSKRGVNKVFAFDPSTGEILVKLDDGNIGSVTASEVEAIDEARNFHDVAETARRMAGYVVPGR